MAVLNGQNIDRANDLYKNGGFAEAIPIYEAALVKKPNSMAIKVKLANCHRILSHPNQAARLFAEIIESKDAKPADFMHYGETLMMLEKYDSAKIYFRKFNDLKPDDERGLLMLKNVDKVKTLRPLFAGVTVYPFLHNSDGDDNAPVWIPRGIVFATDRPSNFKLLKEKNPATGRDYTNIYVAERTSDTSFNVPKEFSSKLSELNRNTSNATFTADGQRVYFCQNGNTPSKGGAYNMQIFTAETTGNGWKNVEPLPFCTPENNYMYPSVSPDGQRLFLVAERGGGFGGLDLYMSNKTKKGWSRLENLGDRVNTAAHEGFPFAVSNSKLYFCSKGHAGYGGYDIFMTEQDSLTGEWRTPKNIGTPFNCPYDDISICFDAANKHGAFTSTRGGRGDDLFIFSIDPELAKRQAAKAVETVNSKNIQTAEIVPETTIKTETLKPSTPVVIETKTSGRVIETSLEQTLEQKKEEKKVVTIVNEAPKTPQKIEEKVVKVATVETPKIDKIETKIEEKKIGRIESKTEKKNIDKAAKIEQKTADKTTEGYSIAADNKLKTPPSVSTTPSNESGAEIHYLKRIQTMIDADKSPKNKAFVIENAHYSSYASTEITPDLALGLDKIAEFLTRNRKLTIEIKEHTETKDLTATRAKQISTARAENIIKYLVAQGVNVKRMSSKGVGKTQPLKDCSKGNCSTEEDERNRRTELIIN
ncbi:MAG: OmpA family protein [Saprospiraceae bacterium]|nr:OmpA family protein [Saprospiraceae bacterium]